MLIIVVMPLTMHRVSGLTLYVLSSFNNTMHHDFDVIAKVLNVTTQYLYRLVSV